MALFAVHVSSAAAPAAAAVSASVLLKQTKPAAASSVAPTMLRRCPPRAVAAQAPAVMVAAEEEEEVPQRPTPVLPSGKDMAAFLLTYSRMLEHVPYSGDAAYETGATVLERVRVGLMGLMGHPKHGVQGGSQWMGKEKEVETCLCELEKDIDMLHRAHERKPGKLALQMTCVHCCEAARLVYKL